MEYYRDTYLVIDLDAIYHNIKEMKHYHKQIEIMAVVKADAYGHGAILVAKTALSAGASYLAVATMDEAIELRKNDIKAPILIFGSIRPTDIKLACLYHLTITVHNLRWLNEALSFYQGEPVDVHLQVETGMNRLGLLTMSEFLKAYHLLKEAKHFTLKGIYSHLASSETEDESYNQYQMENFDRFISQIDTDGLLIHIANSGGSIKKQPNYINMVRLGIFLYGLKPRNSLETPFILKEALSLYSTLVQVKTLPPHSKLSYNGIYETSEKEIIGTIPIGYADGYDRRMEKGFAYIENEFVPIVGRICMDYCLVKLPKEYPEGTKVELIGPHIPIDQYANWIKTINYHAVCELSDRLPRIYKKEGQIIQIINRRLKN